MKKFFAVSILLFPFFIWNSNAQVEPTDTDGNGQNYSINVLYLNKNSSCQVEFVNRFFGRISNNTIENVKICDVDYNKNINLFYGVI